MLYFSMVAARGRACALTIPSWNAMPMASLGVRGRLTTTTTTHHNPQLFATASRGHQDNNNNNVGGRGSGGAARGRGGRYDPRSGVCFICGEKGHRRDDCPKKKTGGGGRGGGGNNRNNNNNHKSNPLEKQMPHTHSRRKSELSEANTKISLDNMPSFAQAQRIPEHKYPQQQQHTSNGSVGATSSSTAPQSQSQPQQRRPAAEDDDEDDDKPPPRKIPPVGECDLCRRQFGSEMALLHHVHVEHLGVNCEYTASPEEWTFPKDSMFQCRICHHKTFTHHSGLLGHYNTKHPDSIPTRKSDVWVIQGHRCNEKGCGKLFASQELLDGHKFCDHGVNTRNTKPFRCEECLPTGKEFASPFLLIQHILVTHGEEQHCQKGGVMPRTGQFDCFFCDRSFLSLSALIGHITGKHAKFKIEEKPAMFKQYFGPEGYEILNCAFEGCGCKFVCKEHQAMHHEKCPKRPEVREKTAHKRSSAAA